MDDCNCYTRVVDGVKVTTHRRGCPMWAEQLEMDAEAERERERDMAVDALD
jgi:hypothetical protein